MLPALAGITNYSLKEIITGDTLRVTFFLPEAILILILIFACKRYNFQLLNFSSSSKKQLTEYNVNTKVKETFFSLYVLVLLPVLLLAVLNMVLFVSQTNAFPNTYLNLFTSSFGLVVVTVAILSISAIKNISDLKEKEFEARNAKETISQLEKIIRVIRKQRHDFNHHLQTIYGLLEVNSYEMARDYIQQIFLDISTPAEVVKTGNPGISAMLYAKAGLAEARGIHFYAQVDCSLRNIPLTVMEANSILGNLLDNAIEAAADHSQAERHVRLEIAHETGEYIFTVANTGEPISQEILDRMYEPRYTTKEKHNGLGLSIIKETVEKYTGTIDVDNHDHETVFTVHIPASKEKFHDQYK